MVQKCSKFLHRVSQKYVISHTERGTWTLENKVLRKIFWHKRDEITEE
jgi:hypothetical protein